MKEKYNLDNNYDAEAIEAMEMWIETGCVKQSYLEKVLGDQSVGISVSPSK